MDCARSGIPDNCGRDNKWYDESKKKKHSNGSFFSDLKTSNFRQCKVFNRKHGVWSCEVFQRMNINNKWNTVKKEKLFVAWVMIITQKIAKEEENVEYKIVTRTIKIVRFSE